jgi:hypothetical protein
VIGLSEEEAIAEGYLPQVPETSVKPGQLRFYKDRSEWLTYVVLSYPFGEPDVDHRERHGVVLIVKSKVDPSADGDVEWLNMGANLFTRSREVEDP